MLAQKIHGRSSEFQENAGDYMPKFFRINNVEDKSELERLIDLPQIKVTDTIEHQLKELVKTMRPDTRLKPDEVDRDISTHLNGTPLEEYGVWVYYPWKNTVVHLLDEQEFTGLRTNRNKYKITEEEQSLLATKTIGIIGLSVGQSIALTIVMERICGSLRLADFDTADLSNLNRLRTGVTNIGLKKTVIVAREIMEIDPFIKLELFNDGITEENIGDFFTKNGKLDLMIEVCDGLDIKILSRYKARELGIPVIMDTNDRGMLDVERFDLEPQRAILHGLAGNLDPNTIKGLSNEDKVPYILSMVGADTLSTRMKASMLEVAQSISTWPQLASSVALGGALTTDVSRRILLGQFHASGRYYVDFDELVKDAQKVERQSGASKIFNPYKPLEKTKIEALLFSYFEHEEGAGFFISGEQLAGIIDAAIAAPSAGNNQPWKWAYRKGVLFLFHDCFRSWSWGDYDRMGSFMSLGTAIENVHLQAALLGLNDQVSFFPLKDQEELVCAIRFSPGKDLDDTTRSLGANIYKRHTNRNLSVRKEIPESFYQQFKHIIEATGNVKILYTTDAGELAELGSIIAECDKIRLLNEQGHEEFYNEIRWNEDDARRQRDGIEITSAGLTQSEMAGFNVAKDWQAIKLLKEWEKGDAFMKLSVKAINSASAVVVIAVPKYDHLALVSAGREIEKGWIFANQSGVSVYPFLSAPFFFSRVVHGKGQDLQPHIINKLLPLRERFMKIFDLRKENYSEVFIMKLSISDDLGTRSLRKPKSEVFFDLD